MEWPNKEVEMEKDSLSFLASASSETQDSPRPVHGGVGPRLRRLAGKQYPRNSIPRHRLHQVVLKHKGNVSELDLLWGIL